MYDMKPRSTSGEMTGIMEMIDQGLAEVAGVPQPSVDTSLLDSVFPESSDSVNEPARSNELPVSAKIMGAALSMYGEVHAAVATAGTGLENALANVRNARRQSAARSWAGFLVEQTVAAADRIYDIRHAATESDQTHDIPLASKEIIYRAKDQS